MESQAVLNNDIMFSAPEIPDIADLFPFIPCPDVAAPASPDTTVANDVTDHSYSQRSGFDPETAIEGDEIHYTDNESDGELDADPVVRKSGRVRCPKRRFSGDSDLDEEDIQSKKKTSKKISLKSFSNGKKKLYSSGPFSDPDKERCRLNALNAKKNRDRKKKEQEKMLEELDRLKIENTALRRKSVKMNERAENAENELRRLQELLRDNNLENLLKLKDVEE